MAKTYWVNDSDTLTIYPARAVRTLSVVYLFIFSVINIVLYINHILNSVSGALIFEALIVVICLFLFALGTRKVVFDRGSRMMYLKVFNLVIRSIPFDKIASITPYGMMGGTNYRVFTRENKHGKGIMISAGYAKRTNQNLIAYEQEVLPKINELVFSNRPIKPKEAVYDFKYFKENGNIYKLSYGKVMNLIVGIYLSALTVYLLLHPGFLANEVGYKRILITFFPLLLGLILINSFFSVVIFDKGNRQITNSTLGGLIKRVYSFDDFYRFVIVRKRINFIYTGTEVRAQLRVPNTDNKFRQFFLIHFRNTKKIEHFIDEADTILGRFGGGGAEEYRI